MKNAATVALYQHWQRLRGSGTEVARADIQPRDFGPLLPDLFLLETDLAAGAPFRYCGAALARRYGRDLEGEGFLALWGAADQALVRRHLAEMGDHRSGVVMGVMAETAGAGVISFELLLLPLKGHESADSTIGSMMRIGGHDDANRIRARIVSQEIRSVRILGDERQGGRWSRLKAERMSPPTEKPRRSSAPFRSRARHLTLVIGGK